MSATLVQKPFPYGGEAPLVGGFKQADRVHQHIFEYTGPVSYSSGGDAFSNRLVGAPVFVGISPDNIGDYFIQYDYTNNKLVWYVMSTGLEVTATTDLHTKKAKLLVIHRKTT